MQTATPRRAMTMSEMLDRLAVVQLWQVTLVFIFVGSIGRFEFAKRRPHLMLLLWVLFLVKCLVPPVIHSPVSPMSKLTPGELVQMLKPVSATEPAAPLDNALDRGAIDQVVGGSVLGTFGQAIDLSWKSGLMCLWIVGSSVVFITLATHYFVVRRRIRVQAIADDDVVARDSSAYKAAQLLRQLESKIGLAPGGVRIVVSRDSIGPLVFGFWRPTIVIPSELLEREESLGPILTHELCHVWRRDHLLGFLQMAVQSVFWFHPFVWMASGRINRLCEICCDDDTLRLFGLNSKLYASGLLDVLSLQRVVRPIRMAPGIRPVEVTRQRIQMITANERPRGRRSQMIIFFVFICVVLPSTLPDSRQARSQPVVPSVMPNQVISPERLATHRREMDFFLGDWSVSDAAGQVIGTSRFEYEKSGNMIREDWTAADGSTAQGVTFYDSNELCWKMTWVDSMGNLMESSGQWQGDALVLDGFLTGRDGGRRKARTILTKQGQGELVAEMRIDRQGKLVKVSSSHYRRAN